MFKGEEEEVCMKQGGLETFKSDKTIEMHNLTCGLIILRKSKLDISNDFQQYPKREKLGIV